MGPGRLELPTSRLSGVRSNQLSYEPVIGLHRATRERLSASIALESAFVVDYIDKLNKEQQKNRC